MVATISYDQEDINETISTLKFSQNVASIKNDYRVNEEQDPSAIIKRLRKEIETLKNEIKLLKGFDRGNLTNDEKSECNTMVNAFLGNRD